MFRLALALGMPVRQLLNTVGSDELTEWMAFYQLEPFGDMRGDYRSGVVASTFANAHRAEGVKPFTPEDFMPFMVKQQRSEGSKDEASVNLQQLNVQQFKAMFAHKLVKKEKSNV